MRRTSSLQGLFLTKGGEGCEQKNQRRKWYGDSDAVIFVQSTPGELLKKRVHEVMKENGMRVKVVKQGRRTIKSLLQKSTVHPNMTCEMEDCPICLT